MASPRKIREIMAEVNIPVMAKVRIGHFAEAQILQELGVDFIDESEVLTPADETHHIDKHAFKTPFVCGARNLGEALEMAKHAKDNKRAVVDINTMIATGLSPPYPCLQPVRIDPKVADSLATTMTMPSASRFQVRNCSAYS